MEKNDFAYKNIILFKQIILYKNGKNNYYFNCNNCYL